jgi:trigger factor
MNIAIEEVSACRRRLRIEVPANRVAEEVSRVCADFQKHAQIKGFRAGKAPLSVIEKRYAKEIEEEVKRLLIPIAFRDAIKDKNLKVSTALNIEEVHYVPGVCMSFSTLVDLEPIFSLPEYRGLKVRKSDTAVSDADVNETIDRVRNQMADYKTVEGRPVQENDLAVVTYEGMLDGKPLVDLLPNARNLAKNKNFWVMVNDDSFLPGFAKQLIGATSGDSRRVDVVFPADFPQEDLRGRTASYDVKIEEIKEAVLPEFNDEFARQIANTTADDLKMRITANLRMQKEEKARSEHVRQIFEQLGGRSNFDLPESSVQNQTRSLIYDIVRENEMRGVPGEVLEERKQDIFANAQSTAKDQVKLGFILGKIAEAEKIEVTSDELIAEISRIAAKERIATKKLIKQLQENDGFSSIRDSLLSRKAVDFLLQSASIE